MRKQSLEIQLRRQVSIQVGDTVRIIDGSALSVKDDPDRVVSIVHPYPDTTGSEDILERIPCTVLEVGIINHVHPFEVCGIAYLQDLVIQVGDAEFRTNSRMVRKL